MRLPLPVDGPAGVLAFEPVGPTAAVLTGLLWPSSGPLTSWAPVYSTLEATGTLKEAQTGGWIGPIPDRWLKVVKPGYVVGGFRVLVKTAPGAVQTRQVQIFWKPWSQGEAKGAFVESRPYGQPAGTDDTVKIIELRLPDGAIPIGLYGQTLAGAVVQTSLVVRQTPRAAAVRTPKTGPKSTSGPTQPEVPAPIPLAPVDLRGISQEQR